MCDLCNNGFILVSSLDKHKLECDKSLEVKDNVVIEDYYLSIKTDDITEIKVEDLKEDKEDPLSCLDDYEEKTH